MNIAIIGTGLIGGSIAIALRGFQTLIIGVEKNEVNAKEALELGLVDEILPLEQAVRISDLVVIAIPVNASRDLLPHILNHIGDHTVVVDMGSTKAGICEEIRNHQMRKNFVASHPIAGTEYSGPRAAIPNLFDNKITIICESELSGDFALRMVEKMYKILKMNVIYMDPIEHDRHIAFVSHISHITSFTLGLTVLDIEKNESNIFNMAGSGFASTVRLAKSSPEMWAPIFKENSQNLLEALNSYIEKLTLFRNYIEEGNTEELKKLMSAANDIKRIIK